MPSKNFNLKKSTFMSFAPIQKIFILAGESSGDYIGSSVMRGLTVELKIVVYFMIIEYLNRERSTRPY